MRLILLEKGSENRRLRRRFEAFIFGQFVNCNCEKNRQKGMGAEKKQAKYLFSQRFAVCRFQGDFSVFRRNSAGRGLALSVVFGVVFGRIKSAPTLVNAVNILKNRDMNATAHGGKNKRKKR